MPWASTIPSFIMLIKLVSMGDGRFMEAYHVLAGEEFKKLDAQEKRLEMEIKEL